MTLPNYPNNPTLNEQFTVGTNIYQWDGEKWKALSNADNSLRTQLADVDSSVLVGGVEAGDIVKSSYTLAELASATLPLGRIVTVSERDNARFIAVSGETPNGFDILPTADLAVQLLDIPKPENMGIVADWNGTTGTDNTAAYLRYNTLCQEKGVSQNWKAGQYYFASVELPVSVDLKGEKGTEFFIQPAVDLRNAFLLDPDVIFKRVILRPAITNSTKNFFENTFADDFDYHNLLMGFRMDDDCLAIDVQSLQMERGVTGRNGARNFKIVRGLYQAGEWGTSIFNCFDIQMLDVDVIGGNSGGMAMPSCKRVTVSGGTVINPDGTGINTGGSAAVGFNAEDITVVNTRTYARDCVNLENGCEVATITGNNVNVISSSTSNGVGIGVHTRSGGGRVNQITVTGNTIRSTFGQYSEGIKLGDADAGFDSYGFTVGHNTIEGCRRGILLENNNAGFKNYDFQVGPNKVVASDRAYSFYGTHEDGVIEGGILKRSSATTVSSTYGMELGTLKKVQINGVTTKGWSPHIRQLGTVTASKISQHTFLKGDDEANFLQLSNQSGGADITIDVTV